MTTRRIDQPPLDDVGEDDFLTTNSFVSGVYFEDLSIVDKNNFREYTDLKKSTSEFSDSIIIDKNASDVISTDRESIISIDTRYRDTNTFPEPNHVIMPFGKIFYNIKQIKLVSTEFPNTDQVIRNTPVELKNNTVSWQNLVEDGGSSYEGLYFFFGTDISQTIPGIVVINIADNSPIGVVRPINQEFYIYIYQSSFERFNGRRKAYTGENGSVNIYFEEGIPSGELDNLFFLVDFGKPEYTMNITPGNYNLKTLASTIEENMNLMRRGGGKSSSFHFFKVNADLNTDIVSFDSYIIRLFSSNPISVVRGSGIITASSSNHGYNVGDQVLILDLKSIAGISSDTLNGLQTVKTVINTDNYTYEVNITANQSTSGGGLNAKEGKPDKFRMLFKSRNSRIVENLGFPYEDSGEYIGVSNPITTKTLTLSNMFITGNYVRFITSIPHELKGAIINEIDTISADGKIRTVDPHNITVDNVDISGSDFIPDGRYTVINTGNYTFTLRNINGLVPGTGGFVKHSGDKINLINFKSSPRIFGNMFAVENVSTSGFDVNLGVSFIDPSNIKNTIIGTGQIKIQHIDHGFLEITSISAGSDGIALITTSYPHGLDTGIKVFFSGTDSTPRLDSIEDVAITRVNSTQFTVFLSLLGLDDNISVNGTTGIIGRGGSNKIALNRIIAPEKGSNFIGGIPLSVLNGEYHYINVIDKDSYMIRLEHNSATETITAGGENVVVSSSRHGFKDSQSNTFNGNKDGTLFKNTSVEGENYALLTSPGIDTVHVTGRKRVSDIFAKLLLSDPPGNMIFNSFISAPKIFNPPLSSIREIQLDVVRKDGYPYNMQDSNYSLSLSIIESVDRIKTTGVSSRTGESGLY
jgi:hypothetical protein